jgi:alpha-beta hydrolase superfamily lysophospholipase
MSVQLDEGAITRREPAGPPLYFHSAMPAGEVKAVVGIIHGYAEHGARYTHVMGALAEHGIGSVAIDLRGHGRAGGARGFCLRFDEYHDDARELTSLVEARAKGAPVFLFGHSFGGLVATSFVLRDAKPWRGLVLSGPYFGLALEVPRVKILAGRVASRVYPKLGIPSGLAGKDVTHDPVKAREYDTDPLVFKNATARWFTEASAEQKRVLDNASRLTLPLYVTFGTADPVASMSAAKRVFDAAGSADKTWDPREGLLHEVLNEPSWKDIAESIAKWILAHS